MARHAWQSLRWRLVGAQMLVVFVGVSCWRISAQIALRSLPPQIETTLTALVPGRRIADHRPDDGCHHPDNAASRATIVGACGHCGHPCRTVSSILLMREILRPLDDIVDSSRRIADGHYDERVALPASDELAVVATNFNEMAESLAQVEQQRVEMIGNVAHELRTPLTGLRGYLEGLLDGLFPSNSETFGHMYQEVRRLQRLIDDLQALSRVEAGQFELTIQAFDLNSVVDSGGKPITPTDRRRALNADTTTSVNTP
jgi:histidine kinase